MAKTRSMTRNQNHDDDDDASSRNRSKARNKRVVATWSDLNHDLLYLVMMRLGVVDFISFGRVCKSWRSLVICNRERFLASRPPLLIWKSFDANGKDYFYLKDVEGRKFKTIVPHSAGRNCVGSTCGYLILFGKETKDLWLVNPITRHQLHFPASPCLTSVNGVKATLVFSPSTSGWVFVMANRCADEVWFSIAGEGAWNRVSSTFPIMDLHAFKGKIYMVDSHSRLCELRLDPTPKLTLLEIKNFREPNFWLCEIASSGENLYSIHLISPNSYELDFGKMEWVVPEEKKRQ